MLKYLFRTWQEGMQEKMDGMRYSGAIMISHVS